MNKPVIVHFDHAIGGPLAVMLDAIVAVWPSSAHAIDGSTLLLNSGDILKVFDSYSNILNVLNNI